VQKLDAMLRREIEGYARHLKSKADVTKAQEEALLTSLSNTDSELSSYPNKEAHLATFDRVIDALQSDYRALVDKEIQARLERIGSADWNVLVLQPASDPKPVRVTDLVRLALIPVIGLIAAIGFAFLIDGLDHSIKDPIEAERHFGLPVLGSVGRMR
jgi:capsular polysaccharide biosynthesis protein